MIIDRQYVFRLPYRCGNLRSYLRLERALLVAGDFLVDLAEDEAEERTEQGHLGLQGIFQVHGLIGAGKRSP